MIVDHNTREGCSLVLHDRLPWVPGKPYAVNLGVVTEDTPFCCDPLVKSNVVDGFCKRIAPIMPRASRSELEKLRFFVKKWLVDNDVPVISPDFDIEGVFREKLAATKHYNLNRKKQLLEAYESLRYHPIDENDYRVSSFVKREFYEDFKPLRLINSRSDRFKARVLPFIHKIEEYFMKHRNFIKGVPEEDRPALLNRLRDYPYVLETDYSSFESGFNNEYCWAVECELWKHCLKHHPDVLSEILSIYNPRIRVINGVPRQFRSGKWRAVVPGLKPRREVCRNPRFTYRVSGSRMSGEMFTSLANGFSNLMNIMYLMKKYSIDGDGFVEGDDGLFGLSSDKISKEDFERFGFRIKMNYGRDLSHTSFCGNVFDPVTLNNLVSPEQISRLGWTNDPTYLHAGPRVTRALLKAKAMSLYVTGKHTPIASTLALKIIQVINEQPRFEKDWYNIGVQQRALGSRFDPVEILDRDRWMYATVFGISPPEQLAVESLINKWNGEFPLELPYSFMTDHFMVNQSSSCYVNYFQRVYE